MRQNQLDDHFMLQIMQQASYLMANTAYTFEVEYGNFMETEIYERFYHHLCRICLYFAICIL
ncbi:MAG TPA: hypothetical protein PLK14_15230 [Sediminibacterium sp.]|nr:hypothetical protein [Sediminibacterium sp.]HQS56459.1 hypothetical protein [Sediminibacterium sp.]